MDICSDGNEAADAAPGSGECELDVAVARLKREREHIAPVRLEVRRRERSGVGGVGDEDAGGGQVLVGREGGRPGPFPGRWCVALRGGCLAAARNLFGEAH